MNAAARRLELIKLLREDITLDNNKLAEQLNVSVMTIRRDLNLLQQQGLLTVTHGGAILDESMAMEHSYSIKKGQMMDEKRRIGIAAAQLVRDGDTLFIDCGTTPREVAEALVGRNIELSVFTNSLLCANILMQESNIQLNMVPGTFRSKSMGFIGTQTVQYIANYRFDKVFLGIEGLDAEYGASTPNIDDALTKTAVVEASNNVIVVSDHTKMGRRTLVKICPLDNIQTVVTGTDMPEDLQQSMESQGVDIIIAREGEDIQAVNPK